jgi:hypothetical protein
MNGIVAPSGSVVETANAGPKYAQLTPLDLETTRPSATTSALKLAALGNDMRLL